MATLLGDLSEYERISLAQLCNHPGFRILEKLFADMCNKATQEVISLKSDTPDFEKVVVQRRIEARITHRICSSILASVSWYMNEITTRQAAEQQAQQEASKVVDIKPLLQPKVAL